MHTTPENRRAMRQQTVNTRKRKALAWCIAILAVLVLLFAGAGVYQLVPHPVRPDFSQPLPGPSMQPVPSLTPKASSTPQPTQPATILALANDPGTVVQLWIPSATDAPPEIKTTVAPMPPATDCHHVIHPPDDTLAASRGVYHCTDYGKRPGEEGEVVLAGHASIQHDRDTMFDRLQYWGDGLTGHEIYLRTTNSGDKWLIYRASKVYTPSKTENEDLATKTEIWTPTPRRLILVTCLEIGQGASVDNYIVVGTFEGVTN